MWRRQLAFIAQLESTPTQVGPWTVTARILQVPPRRRISMERPEDELRSASFSAPQDRLDLVVQILLSEDIYALCSLANIQVHDFAAFQ